MNLLEVIKIATGAKPEYVPKFCRARGCNLPNGHDGPCSTAAVTETCRVSKCYQQRGHIGAHDLGPVGRGARKRAARKASQS